MTLFLDSHRRRAAAAVEFAVLVPLLVLVVIGMMELGRGIMVGQILVDAARRGCRIAIVEDSTRQEVLEAVDDSLTNSGISLYQVRLNPDPPSQSDSGEAVVVTVEAAFEDVTWLPATIFSRGRTLRGSCTMSRE